MLVLEVSGLCVHPEHVGHGGVAAPHRTRDVAVAHASAAQPQDVQPLLLASAHVRQDGGHTAAKFELGRRPRCGDMADRVGVVEPPALQCKTTVSLFAI